ncbi:hypothetical protein [Burkholderia metallica]
MLASWLRLEIKQHHVALIEIRIGGELRTRLSGLQRLPADFLLHCRLCGLTPADYPFNTPSHAIRSLSARVKSELLNGFGIATRAAGATHLKGLPRSDDFAAPATTRPYQDVEFEVRGAMEQRTDLGIHGRTPSCEDPFDMQCPEKRTDYRCTGNNARVTRDIRFANLR